MDIRTFLTVLLLIFLSGCSTIKVSTDYDPNTDLNSSKEFAIVHKTLEGENTLTSDRIISALKSELRKKGYIEVSQKEADLYFLFHTGVTSKIRIDRDYQYVNMYPYSYGYGYHAVAVPRTREYTYNEAKLIVDAVLPDKNKIVWRGTAIDYLKDYDTPQQKTRYINKVLKALMKSFPK